MGTLGTAIYFLAAPMTREIMDLSGMIKTFAQSQQDLSFLPDSWETFMRETASMDSVQSFFTIEKITELTKEIGPRLWGLVSGSVNIVLSLAVVLIMLLYVIFILLDFEKISTGWIRLVPTKYRDITQIVSDYVKFSMNKYYRNQAMIAFIVGTLYTIGFSIIGLPMAIVMGIIIMFLNLIPYLQTFAIPPIILLVLLKSIQTDQSFGMGLLLFGIVFALVQGFQDGYLVPKVMGKAMGLNPAIVLLSLTVWGSLLGIIGMIIALPFTSIITIYYRRFVLYEDNQGAAYSDSNPPPSNESII
jgi:predicted PurR-regulated permease PerM